VKGIVRLPTAIEIDPFVTAMQKAPDVEQLDDWANAGPALTAERINAIAEVATARSTMPILLSVLCQPVLRWLSAKVRSLDDSLVCLYEEPTLSLCV
jgi:ribosomal protein L10